jgi:hypothetical protein
MAPFDCADDACGYSCGFAELLQWWDCLWKPLLVMAIARISLCIFSRCSKKLYVNVLYIYGGKI